MDELAIRSPFEGLDLPLAIGDARLAELPRAPIRVIAPYRGREAAVSEALRPEQTGVLRLDRGCPRPARCGQPATTTPASCRPATTWGRRSGLTAAERSSSISVR